MKTVGQAGEIAIIIRRDQPQRIAGDWLKPRLVECLLIEDNESRELSGSIEQALRDADVDDDCAGRRFGERRKRRELLTAFGLRLRALGEIEPAQRLRRDKATAWAGKEIFDHIRSRPPVGDRRAARQRQRFDADDPNILLADPDGAFQDGRDGDAGAAQSHEELLVKQAAARGDERSRAAARNRVRRGVITVARLSVQRLHAAPQRRGDGETEHERREVARPSAPVADQRGERPERLSHTTSVRTARMSFPTRAQSARSGIQSKTSVLGLALDSRSGLRPAGNDTVQANGSVGIRFIAPPEDRIPAARAVAAAPQGVRCASPSERRSRSRRRGRAPAP